MAEEILIPDMTWLPGNDEPLIGEESAQYQVGKLRAEVERLRAELNETRQWERNANADASALREEKLALEDQCETMREEVERLREELAASKETVREMGQINQQSADSLDRHQSASKYSRTLFEEEVARLREALTAIVAVEQKPPPSVVNPAGKMRAIARAALKVTE